MKLSKYVESLKIKNDLYVLYNRFLFEPIFVNEKEKNDVLKSNFCNFTDNEIKKLKKIGIIIKSQKQDTMAFNRLYKYINKEIKNKISLMYIIGNNNCNMACKYCFIGKLNNQKPLFMKPEILEIAIQKFAKHIKSKNLKKGIIVFYGAEPLINFSLIKHAVKYIKNNKFNIQISLVTNGTLITKEVGKFIKRNNIGIGISIDGPKEYNDTMRVTYNDGKGTYDNVMKNIQMFQNEKIPFGLSITLNEYALNHQEEYLYWLKNINVKEITYNLMHYDSINSNWKNYYRKVAKFLFTSNKILKDEGVIEGRINRKYDAFYKREFKYSDCGAIGANILDIKKIDDLFKTEEYKKWNKHITLNNDSCINCPYIYMCGGGCALESKNMFNSEFAIDIPFCMYTREITKLILKEFYELSVKENIKNYENVKV